MTIETPDLSDLRGHPPPPEADIEKPQSTIKIIN